MAAVTVKTYAKINLSLDILRKRSDGYHDVKMVMHQVDLYDVMTVDVAIADSVSISLKSNKQSVPEDESNLAHKAAKLIIEEYGKSALAVSIYIDKRIPIAAGLAGGSSNAAGAILGLNHLLGLGLSIKELMSIGGRLGADVPFCIMGQAALDPRLGVKGGAVCALAEGIGDILTPLPELDAWVLLSKPQIEVSTASVYNALRVESIDGHPDTTTIIEALERNDIKKIQVNMANVLETITLTKYPNVKNTRDLMTQNNSTAAMMSGSGPTVFSLFSDFEEGRELFETMKQVNEETFFVKTCKVDSFNDA